jgi:hypothetical protein
VISATISASGQSAVLNVSGDNSAVVHIKGGTVNATGLNLTFEASVDSTDGVNGTWFGVTAARTNANTAETTTGVLALNIGVANAYGWRLGVGNFRFLRLRATALTAGNAVISMSADASTMEPNPVIPTHAVTQSGTWTVTQTTPSGTGYSLTSAASTNAAVIKSTAGNLFELTVSNPTATAAVVKLYDKATAPTVGTDVPKVTIPVAAGSFVVVPLSNNGKRFSAGIGIAVTANAVATDTTAAVAGVQVHGTFI